MTIDLVFHPVPSSPGRFDVQHGMARIVRSSRQPLLDAARVLLAEGDPPETVIEARHAGSDIVAQRGTVGEAAKWTVGESDRGGLRRTLWRPFQMAPRSCPVDPDFEQEAAE